MRPSWRRPYMRPTLSAAWMWLPENRRGWPRPPMSVLCRGHSLPKSRNRRRLIKCMRRLRPWRPGCHSDVGLPPPSSPWASCKRWRVLRYRTHGNSSLSRPWSSSRTWRRDNMAWPRPALLVTSLRVFGGHCCPHLACKRTSSLHGCRHLRLGPRGRASVCGLHGHVAKDCPGVAPSLSATAPVLVAAYTARPGGQPLGHSRLRRAGQSNPVHDFQHGQDV